jgi:hypothetical protein
LSLGAIFFEVNEAVDAVDCSRWKREFGRELRSNSHAMAEKSGKKKPSKSAKSQPSVLGSLSTTRPERLGRERTGTATRSPKSSRAATKSSGRATKSPRPAADARPRPTPPPEPEGRRREPPSGPELVTTAVQATAELAGIGLAAGARALRRAAARLPRP